MTNRSSSAIRTSLTLRFPATSLLPLLALADRTQDDLIAAPRMITTLMPASRTPVTTPGKRRVLSAARPTPWCSRL
jgi:hypothetical protein